MPGEVRLANAEVWAIGWVYPSVSNRVGLYKCEQAATALELFTPSTPPFLSVIDILHKITSENIYFDSFGNSFEEFQHLWPIFIHPIGKLIVVTIAKRRKICNICHLFVIYFVGQQHWRLILQVTCFNNHFSSIRPDEKTFKINIPTFCSGLIFYPSLL